MRDGAKSGQEGSWVFLPHSAFRKDGEAGVRMTGPDDKEEAATPRPEQKCRRQHVQRPCDKDEPGRNRLKPVQLKAAANSRCPEGKSEEQLGQGKVCDCSFRAR